MLTGWTKYQDEEEGSLYLDLSEAISELKRPHPKIYTKQDLEGKSGGELKEILNKVHKEWAEYNKNPFIEGKEEEGEALRAYHKKCTEDLIHYCIEHRIYVSPDEHQTASWGVPIFDDKYIDQFSLSSWADLMAEVWNKIMGRTDLTHRDFYYNDAEKVIKDFKKPR